MTPRVRTWQATTILVMMATGIGAGWIVAQIVWTPYVLVVGAIALGAAWFRIQRDPSGEVTLVPLVVMWLIARGDLQAAVITAVAAGVLIRGVWMRLSPAEIAEGVATEAGPVLLAWGLWVWGGPLPLPARTATIMLGYTVALVAVVRLRAWLVHGVSARAFWVGPGREAAGHLFVCITGAAAVWFLDSRFGLVAAALGVWAIGEAYYPIKGLADQRRLLLGMLGAIAKAVDVKDPYTATHSAQVARYAVAVARELGVPEEEVERIRIAALLHDVGKVGISGALIRKPEGLTPQEQATLAAHPTISADIMRRIALLNDAAELVAHHHEHFDGSGYPQGLAGDDIPLGARVILAADAYDAMTSDRPYRRGRAPRQALATLLTHAGHQFDPVVVRALARVVDPAWAVSSQGGVETASARG